MTQKKVDYLKDLETLNSPNADYSSPECGRLALGLLIKVPGARDSCLEALFRFFLKSSQSSFNSSAPLTENDASKKNAGASPEEIEDLCGATTECLKNLLHKSPKTWLHVVLKWSVQLLTSMAVQSRASGAGYFTAPLEDTVASWMLHSPPSHYAMLLLQQCVSIVTNSKSSSPMTSEDVTAQIMSLVKDNLPNAEWIVAHLGMNYPELILPALVDLGLKQMHEQCDSNGMPIAAICLPGSTQSVTNTPVVKINFVESIAYLSKFHRRLVQQRLVSPLKNAIIALKTRYSLLCFNYVLFCCDKFPDLLSSCLEYCGEQLDLDLLEKAVQTFEKALEHVDSSSVEALIQQTCGLMMKDGTGSLKLFRFFIELHCKTVSKRITKRHHVSIHNLLHYWLLEVQRTSQTRFFSHKLSLTDQLFIMELVKHHTWLTQLYWIMPVHEQAFFIRFYLRALCLAEGDVFAAKLVLHLCTHPHFRVNKILEILAIVKEIHLVLPNVHALIVRNISLTLPTDSSKLLVHLKSLTYLFSLRSEEAESHQAKFSKHIRKMFISFLKFLTFRNLPVARSSLQLLSMIKLDRNIIDEVSVIYRTSTCFTICVSNTIRLEGDYLKRALTEKILVNFLSQFCSSLSQDPLNAFRQLLMKSLFDLTVSKNTRSLFGGQIDESKKVQPQKTYISLLQQNRSIYRGKCSSMPLPLSENTKLKSGASSLDENNNEVGWQTTTNCNFIFTLIHCCLETNQPKKTEKPSESKLDESSVLNLAKLLSHFVCSNVAYSLTSWEDLASEKCNLDRNIKIFNQFDENPLLWAYLNLFAQVRPVLSHVTILLSSIVHVLICFWESTRSADSWCFSKRLVYTERILTVLEKTQFIPTQLHTISSSLASLSPFEIASVLSVCWRYIQENIPDASCYSVSNNSGSVYPERTFMKSLSLQHSDVIHSIFLSNIDTLAHVFPKYLSHQSNVHLI